MPKVRSAVSFDRTFFIKSMQIINQMFALHLHVNAHQHYHVLRLNMGKLRELFQSVFCIFYA